MLTLLLAILVIYLLVKLFRRPGNYGHSYDNFHNNGFSGAGSMVTGMILGYLLSRSLISQDQYDMWGNMGIDELRSTLVDNGVVNDEQFDNLQDQADAGELVNDDANGNDVENYDQYDSMDNSYNDNYDGSNYDDFGSGGDDFGGFDV